MHADLVKLLDLQAKDAVVADVERRLDALQGEFTTLDQALDKARAGLETARRTAADAGRRRDELEAKIESYRLGTGAGSGSSMCAIPKRPPP